MKELTVKIDITHVKPEELYTLSHQVSHLEDRIYYSDDESEYGDKYNPFGEVFGPHAKKFRSKYKIAYAVENLFVPVEEALIDKGFIVERALNLPQVKEGNTIPYYLGMAYIFIPKDK